MIDPLPKGSLIWKPIPGPIKFVRSDLEPRHPALLHRHDQLEQCNPAFPHVRWHEILHPSYYACRSRLHASCLNCRPSLRHYGPLHDERRMWRGLRLLQRGYVRFLL